MSCDKHDELRDLLVRIDERTKASALSIDVINFKLTKYEEQVEKKVSWRTFIIVLTIFSGIMTLLYTKQETLASGLNELKLRSTILHGG